MVRDEDSVLVRDPGARIGTSDLACVPTMRRSYDFSKRTENPYAKRLEKQLTIRLDTDTISYFQGLSKKLGLPYQTLMNMYLRDCAATGRRPQWASEDERRSSKPPKRARQQRRAA